LVATEERRSRSRGAGGDPRRRWRGAVPQARRAAGPGRRPGGERRERRPSATDPERSLAVHRRPLDRRLPGRWPQERRAGPPGPWA